MAQPSIVSLASPIPCPRYRSRADRPERAAHSAFLPVMLSACP
jgi:hypothetical protein